MAGNFVSVSWGDHIEFGVGEGALNTPDAIDHAVDRWQRELGATTILWREARSLKKLARFYHTPGVSRRSFSSNLEAVAMDEQREVIDAAHRRGMKAFVYTTIFDEGWPLSMKWNGGYEGWQSYYVLRRPEHQLIDRRGQESLNGVLCFAYPEVRQYKLGKIQWLLEEYDWDGIFICTRSQSRPAQYGDQFGFNEPLVREFERRYGVDIRARDFDLEAWRRLHGEYLTQFLRDVKSFAAARKLPLVVGMPRADYLGPPIGNLHLDWTRWVNERVVDSLVIDQVAAVCPSTWITMWPRDQGYGYLQNHVDGLGIPPLAEDIPSRWGPMCAQAGVGLYLARMWRPFDPPEHERLLALPGVSGLVFGSFRYDNPDIASRGFWPV